MLSIVCCDQVSGYEEILNLSMFHLSVLWTLLIRDVRVSCIREKARLQPEKVSLVPLACLTSHRIFQLIPDISCSRCLVCTKYISFCHKRWNQ